MNEELPPLTTELKALFEAERKAPPMPASLHAAVWSGLDRALATLPHPKIQPSPAGRGLVAHAVAKHIVIAATSLAVGGGTGMLVQSHLDERRFAAAEVRAAPVSIPPPTASPLPAPPVEELPHVTKHVPRPLQRTTPSPSPEADGVLERQRVLIDTARTALARGDSKGALAQLDQCIAGYPNGELAEEAEALRVQALIGSGAYTSARAAAAEFGAQYPKSLLLPLIDEAVRKIP